MTDPDLELESRLRADAARDQASAPSLADALDIATAPRRRTPWLAAAASVLLVAGLATGAAVWRGGDGDDRPTGVSVDGLPATRGNDVLQRLTNAGFAGVLRVAGQPRALDVVVPYSTEPEACSLFRPEITIVAQGPTQVRLRAAGYSYLPRAKPGQKYVGYSCFGSGTKKVRVTLDAPLGDRRINDADDKASVLSTAVDPTDFPAPTHLPEGYVAGQVIRPGAHSGNLVGQRTYERGADSLTISFGPTRDLDDSGTAKGRTTVAGHRGVVTAEPGGRCLIWSTSPGISRQVCSETGGAPLDIPELLQVARSLR